LLRCSSKQAVASKQAPELVAIAALQESNTSSGACCVARKQHKLWSLAPKLVALQQASKQKKEEDFLPFHVRVGPAPTPATPLQLQPLQLHSHSSSSHSTAARGL